MKNMEQFVLHELSDLIKKRLEAAQKNLQAEEQDTTKRYYKGQADTFNIMLRYIDAMKFEVNLEAMPEAPKKETQASVTPEPEVVVVEEITVPVAKKSKSSKNGRKTNAEKKTDEPESPYKELAHKAVEAKVISRNFSHFYHKMLPEGHITGYARLYKTFEDNEEFRLAIEEALKAPKIEVVEDASVGQTEDAPEHLVA